MYNRIAFRKTDKSILQQFFNAIIQLKRLIIFTKNRLLMNISLHPISHWKLLLLLFVGLCFSFKTQASCTYTLVLEDSAGNGWNGASLEVTENESSNFTTYFLPNSAGNSQTFPLTMIDGGILDFSFWGGALDHEISFSLLDPMGNIALDVNGNPFSFSGTIPMGDLPRVKIDCPQNCNDETIDANIHIVMGDNANEQSWELLDGSGNRIAFANGNYYAGLLAGAEVVVNVPLNLCETYTFNAFDGANNGWSGGSWTVFVASKSYGTELQAPHSYEGYFALIQGPMMNFIDEVNTTFTVPCQTDCPGPVMYSSFDVMTCTGEAMIPIVEPQVCYPNSAHATGCTLNETIIIVPNGDTDAAFEIVAGGFDPNNNMYGGSITVPNLPIGKHGLIHQITYCDGQIARCSTDLLVASQQTPSMICKSDVTINLAMPDNIDNDANGSLIDDLGECIRKVEILEIIALNSYCSAYASYEYELIILDENDNPIVVYNTDGHPLDANGDPILPGFDTAPAHDILSPAQIGQDLKYRLTHLTSGYSCCGTLAVVDHSAPVVLCHDYEVFCTHPDPLNEFYTTTNTYTANQLPANIAGGNIVGGISMTNLEFEVGCGSLGEVVQDFEINLNIEHTDIEDIRILLTPPASTGLGSITLMPYGTCPKFDGMAKNMNVTFTKNANTVIDAPCATGNPILSGNYLPIDLSDFAMICGLDASTIEGTWTIIIMDNDDNGAHEDLAGVGQVVDAELVFQTGFPSPLTVLDCTETEIELEMEMLMDNNCDLTDWIGSTIMRVWKVTDASGNATTCTQNVLIKAPTFNDIDLPADLTLSCSAAGSTEPATTGYPMFGCYDLTNSMEQESWCDIAVTYEDEVSNSCNQRIIRTWKITNWCTTVSQTFLQTIDIIDDEGPSIQVNDADISSGVFSCEGDIILTPSVTDACSAIDQVYATYLVNGITETVTINGSTIIQNLPLGETEITVTAKDACGNSSTESFMVTVADNMAPTASCDDELVVTLNGAGVARLLASDVDEGSNDNCGIEKLEVRRLDGCLGETPFAHYVDFDCCDIGSPVMVELRVTDIYGNSNSCMMSLDIFDKTAPQVVCPGDKVISCEDIITDLSVFGNASAYDNCEATVELTDTHTEIDNCGAGYITRTFTATDNQGLTDVCTQTILVNSVAGYSVTFPEDVMITDCNAAIDNTGEPVFSNDGCGLIATSKDDQIITVVADACYKIKRTWTIMDWCVFDEDNPNITDSGTPAGSDGRTFIDDGDGYTTYVQYIKILDNVSPVIDCPDDITINSLTKECTEEVDISISVSDNCSPSSAFNYEAGIDLNNDGTYDMIRTTSAFTLDLGFGTHRIYWEVGDGCGNLAACEHLITVTDENHPSVGCRDDWNVHLDLHGNGQVNASDLLVYAEDNCTSIEDLFSTVQIRLAGTNDPLASTLDVSCDQEGFIAVEIWVTDEHGNGSYCTTMVEVEDAYNNCDNFSQRVSITGRLQTEEDQSIENAMVTISQNDVQFYSSDDGNFGFNNLLMNQDYTLTASKNDDYSNGISTIDLVFINQHILGINSFESPCQYIAADASGDGKVSTFDIVQLRQLVLYVIDELPNSPSWRFIDKDYVFPDPTNPWLEEFPEFIHYNNLNSDALYSDFMGIKIGDVNGSAVANNLATVEERNFNSSLVFNIENQKINEGEQVCIPFKAKDFEAIEGFQFSLNFDPSKLDFIDFQKGNLNMTSNNFGLRLLEEGVITCSWNDTKQQRLNDDEILFSLCFKANQAVAIADAIALGNRYTPAEVYSTEMMNLELNFESSNASSTFTLYQNHPNPFVNKTNIGFDLPKADFVQLKILDTNGKILHFEEGNFDAGYNQITLDLTNKSSTGIFIYELSTSSQKATKKMVILK